MNSGWREAPASCFPFFRLRRIKTAAGELVPSYAGQQYQRYEAGALILSRKILKYTN